MMKMMTMIYQTVKISNSQEAKKESLRRGIDMLSVQVLDINSINYFIIRVQQSETTLDSITEKYAQIHTKTLIKLTLFSITLFLNVIKCSF